MKVVIYKSDDMLGWFYRISYFDIGYAFTKRGAIRKAKRAVRNKEKTFEVEV